MFQKAYDFHTRTLGVVPIRKGDGILLSQQEWYQHGLTKKVQKDVNYLDSLSKRKVSVKVGKTFFGKCRKIAAHFRQAVTNRSVAAQLAKFRVETSFLINPGELEAQVLRFCKDRNLPCEVLEDGSFPPGTIMMCVYKMAVEHFDRCESAGLGPAMFVTIEDLADMAEIMCDGVKRGEILNRAEKNELSKIEIAVLHDLAGQLGYEYRSIRSE